MRLSRRKKKMTKRHWAKWWIVVGPAHGQSWLYLYRFSAWYCGPREGEPYSLFPHPFAGRRWKR